MITLDEPTLQHENRLARKLLDVFIRAGLVLALTMLCYQTFAPFVALMAWALILAVTVYPTHRRLSRRLKGRQGLSATLLVFAGLVLIVLPSAALMYSMGESVHGLVTSVREHTLQVPPPPDSVAGWPVVGPRLHATWAQAHADLPSVVQRLQPQLGELARKALGMVAGIAGTLLLFVASIIVAGIVMAFGEAGAATARAIFIRVAGVTRGNSFVTLATATIRAVAMGVVGVASIQAIVVGIVLLVAGVPFAGVLAAIVLVLGIAQVPALLVTLPAIAWLWTKGGHETWVAVVYTVLLFLAGMLDNVLKPLLLGRGVDAPMPVILLGALGGLASTGILGMFVGAVLLALGYEIFMAWVATDPETGVVAPDTPAPE